MDKENVYKKLRLSKGLSQKELSDMIFAYNKASSQGSISKLENGEKAQPSVGELMAYSHLFNVTTDYLLGLETVSSKDTAVVDMVHKTHLSEDAIQNILTEGSEEGDNRRIIILDWLLSDKKAFTALIDCIYRLCFPKILCIDRKNTPKPLLNEGNADFIMLSAENVRDLIEDLPEEVYQEMKHVIEDFRKSVANRKAPVPNEFNPF